MTTTKRPTPTLIEQRATTLLRHVAQRFGPANPAYYKSTLQFLGNIPVATERKLSHDAQLIIDDPKLAWEIWSQLFKTSSTFEVKSQALYFAHRSRGKLTLQHWNILKTWSEGVENWAHGDSLCALYAELFEKYPDALLSTYKKWNQSKKPWLRRLSLVGLFYYARSRKVRQPSYKLAHAFIQNLINDDHFYVQKAVGWTLREMYQVYPNETRSLIFSHATTLSPLAIQAATEKFSRATKNSFMALRKKSPAKKRLTKSA